MRKWTLEERQRQAQLIQQWKPWKTAGVKTTEGKAISCMNAWKHGTYSIEIKEEQRLLKACQKLLADIL